jgi:hypothetical protein
MAHRKLTHKILLIIDLRPLGLEETRARIECHQAGIRGACAGQPKEVIDVRRRVEKQRGRSNQIDELTTEF